MGDKIFNKTVIYSCEKHYRQNQCGMQIQEHREAGHQNTKLSHLQGSCYACLLRQCLSSAALSLDAPEGGNTTVTKKGGYLFSPYFLSTTPGV